MLNKKEIRTSARAQVLSSRAYLKTLVFFLVFVLIMGGSPVAMRIGFGELPPFWLSFLRYGLGALVFWILIAFKKLHLPKGRSLIGPLLYGVFGIGFSYLFLAWGLVHLPASLAAIFLALIPLLTVIFASFQGVEQLTLRSVLGAILSVVGTVVAVGAASSYAKISILPIASLVLGAAFLAEGGIMVKRYPPVPPIVTNALAMTVGSLILALASVVSGESWLIPARPQTWAALFYLVFIVSSVGLLLYLEVLEKWTVSATSYGFVIIPFVTAVISTFLLKEQITLNFLIGLSIVVVGVMIGALLHQKEKDAVKCATC
jgi:drug/metabolite transporter (DMT)-like permease